MYFCGFTVAEVDRAVDLTEENVETTNRVSMKKLELKGRAPASRFRVSALRSYDTGTCPLDRCALVKRQRGHVVAS